MPTGLVRSGEPITEGICIAIDAGTEDENANVQIWWWNPGGDGCASTNSSIVPATGAVDVVDGIATVSFEIPRMFEASDDLRLPIVRDGASYSVQVSGRLVRLEPINELRLRSPGGMETPMP
jgi:hypothetical protein